MERRDFLRSAALGITSGIVGVNLCETASAAANKSDKRPNILWIMLDDGRADTLGCYGAPWAKTPNLDALAKDGVRFEVAIVQNPVCVPSRKSMKTGMYAHQVGPVAMGKAPQTKGDYIDTGAMKRINELPNLLDAWTQAGTRPVNVGKTHGFRKSFDLRGDAPMLLNVVGKPTSYFQQKFGADSDILKAPRAFTKTHGWQIGGVLDIKPEETETWRLGNMAVDTLTELAAKKDPFFLRVSFHAPHVACYVPRQYYTDPKMIDLPLPTDEEVKSKPKFEQGPLHTYCGADLTREQIDLCRGTYYGMVSLVDVQVGRIVETLKKSGRLDNTIIAFTSDQGFQLGEHGLWKKRVFYDDNVKVPLIFHCPAVLPAGRVIDEPVEMIDFLPTLMELSGLDVPGNIRGRSLMPLIEGKVRKWRPACFSELDHSQSMYRELRRGTGRRVMVRTKQWKLIYFMDNRVADKDGALYNLKEDPHEQVNLYNKPGHRRVIRRLEGLAEKWDRGEI
ncbi:MAG: sulfatase family protein [Planctomycetota bacterium]|jgi:arylsulfatase A-like enzyme